MHEKSWQDAILEMPSPRVADSLKKLAEGHKRFLEGRPRSIIYTKDKLQSLAAGQTPVAAVVACSDSRVAPEILFDQPLGGIFASRVPGNVASDSAKWMLELAVADIGVPLVIVLGHTGCLAVGEIVHGKIGGGGGSLRLDVQKAVHRARLKNPHDLHREAVIENVGVTLENLRRESFAVQKAIGRGEVGLVGGYYEMDTGEVHLRS
jgi:carbonic anhydrase